MTIIYLLWSLVAGQPNDVDAFASQAECETARQSNIAQLALAKTQAPGKLDDVTISACRAAWVTPPPNDKVGK